MKKLISYLTNQSLIVNLISVGILIAGILFVTNARREAFPNIDFDWVNVSTVYPGATAEDVEKHISILIENELREIDGIEVLFSMSYESLSSMIVKLNPDLENKDKTVSDIINAIDSIDNFPDDAEDPNVYEVNTKYQPVLTIAIINKNDIRSDNDEFELRRYAKILEDRLLNIKEVARVFKKGYRDREMIVEANPDLLDKYHVAINEITMALSKKNLNFPGGLINDHKEELLIRTIGEVENASDISNVLIRANDMGNWVKIGDVAKVKDSFEKEDIINKTEGMKSISLVVLKKQSADIIDLVDKINNVIKKYKRSIPENYEMVIANNLSDHVQTRLNVLKNNGFIGCSLVVISLLLALGWRISLVTALGLPLAFSGTFIWMGLNDISINLMSMFALIMVLGMLVDDAIIVAENIYRHLEEGMGLKDAVINGTYEVIMPVAGTILTTIAAFAPIMFMTGILGKFMWSLPAVVTIALIASWIESMFILPTHVIDIEKRGNRTVAGVNKKKGRLLQFFRKKYYLTLKAVIAHRYIVLFFAIIFLIGSQIFGKHNVKFVLFPQGGVETFIVKAEAPSGTTIEEINKKLSSIERIINTLPAEELDSFTATAGLIQEEPGDPRKKIGSRYGMIIVYLTPEQDRTRKADIIMDSIRERCKNIKGLKKQFKLLHHGPPVGKPVSVLAQGEDFTILQKIADEYKKYLLDIDGLKDVQDNFEEDKKELKIYVDQKTAALTGISVFDIASTVRGCYEGNVATTIKKSEEEIDIRVIFPKKLRKNIKSLKKIKIANRMGNLIPLTSVAKFEKDSGISMILRKDWRRSIVISADIDEHAKDVTSLAVNTRMINDFSDIEERYPGYAVNYEGEFKDSNKSVQSLSRSFLISAIIIFIILASIFKSLLQPFVIFLVVPFTLIGIVWTFYFHGMSLSFLALMGAVGLSGVVINDSIVFVDFINKKRARGLPVNESILEAGADRLRPIFLTTITTFFGLIPTAYGIGGNDAFLKPMALTMSWGLAFGTLLTLLLTPVFYYILSDIKELFSRKNKEKSSPPTQSQHKINEILINPNK